MAVHDRKVPSLDKWVKFENQIQSVYQGRIKVNYFSSMGDIFSIFEVQESNSKYPRRKFEPQSRYPMFIIIYVYGVKHNPINQSSHFEIWGYKFM